MTFFFLQGDVALRTDYAAEFSSLRFLTFRVERVTHFAGLVAFQISDSDGYWV